MDTGIPSDLVKKYRESIPEKLGLMNTIILSLHQESSREKLTELRFIVHKMAGSASMFGYSHVSQPCRNFEQFLVEKLAASDLDLNLAWLKTCDTHFSNVKTAFEET